MASENGKIDYVYILAASHSGSTLLAMLLNSHPDVATIGESGPGAMGDLNTYRCSCGSLIRLCPFWQSTAREMNTYSTGWSLENFDTRFELSSGWLAPRALRAEYRGPLLEALRDAVLAVSPHWRRHFPRIARNCHHLAAAVLKLTGARVFVDSSKLAHRLKFLLRIPQFNVRVIHLVRDGRAVALTYMDQDNYADARDPSLRRGGRGPHAPLPGRKLDMATAADEWVRYMRSADHVLARLAPDRWIEVRYEDLCRDTQPTLNRILDFLGLDPVRRAKEPNQENFRSVEHHVLGNGMRLDSTSVIRLDERWKSALSPAELGAFDAIAGRTNRRYGYTPLFSNEKS